MVVNKRHTPAIGQILGGLSLDSDIGYWQSRIEGKTSRDVERCLSGSVGTYSIDRILTLISPAAEDYLEQMAQLAHQLTIQRFGRTIRLYAPLYLSNYCINGCRYCGFSKCNSSGIKRLTIAQAVTESSILADNGFRDILLVSGEDRDFISVEYLAELAGRLREKFSSVALEVYQMTEDEYRLLFNSGIEAVTLYQETYNRSTYRHYHPSGPKSDYDGRLYTPDAIASAGMREVGLGVLLGLCDWRVECIAMAEHAHYLANRYWQSHISFSFPRLRPAHMVASEQFEHTVCDRHLVQMLLALRLCFADAGLVISTRESAELRNHLLKLGVTKLSAGSRTSPGGYSDNTDATRQFEIDDGRTASQICAMLHRRGFDVVWKDWDRNFLAVES